MFNDKSCLACCWCLFSGSVDRSMVKIKYADFFFSVTKQKLILKIANRSACYLFYNLYCSKLVSGGV